MINLKNSNCDKIQIVTKIKNLNSDKKNNFWQNVKKSFGKKNLTPWQPVRCTPGSVPQCRNAFFFFLLLFPKSKLPYLSKHPTVICVQIYFTICPALCFIVEFSYITRCDTVFRLAVIECLNNWKRILNLLSSLYSVNIVQTTAIMEFVTDPQDLSRSGQ